MWYNIRKNVKGVITMSILNNKNKSSFDPNDELTPEEEDLVLRMKSKMDSCDYYDDDDSDDFYADLENFNPDEE